MTRHLETEPLADADEQALRTLYRERAPEQIEVERAWAATAQRLALRPADERSQQRRRWPAGLHRHQRSGWRMRLAVAAITLAAPVALMGTGLLSEHLTPLDPGMQRIEDEGLYQYVNQTQSLDGVTITVTAAYADRGRTVLFYRVQLDPALAQRYESAVIGSWSLTADSATQAVASPNATQLGTCAPWDTITHTTSCYQIQEPFRPGADAEKLTLTLDITRVYLPLRASHGYDTLTGHWRFQFATAFHQMDVGSADQFFPHLLHLAPWSQRP